MRHARLLVRVGVRVGVAGLAALPLTAAAGTTAHTHDTTTVDERGPDPDQLSEAPALDPGQDTFRADDLVAGTLAPADPRDTDRTGADDGDDDDDAEARDVAGAHSLDAGRPHAGGGAGEPAVSTHAAPSSVTSRAPAGAVPVREQTRPAEAERPRGPLTALVDGLVGPTGLLGGDGLLAGLVGGVVDGPLVAVDAEVSPQVQVGGVLSGGPVTQSTTRTGRG